MQHQEDIKPLAEEENSENHADNPDIDKSELVPERQREPGTPEEKFKTHNYTQKTRYYSIKCGVLLRNIIRWVDEHDGFVTALATVSIALLTYSLAEDSKRQAQTANGQLQAMRDQLREMRSPSSERPYVFLESLNQILSIGELEPQCSNGITGLLITERVLQS